MTHAADERRASASEKIRIDNLFRFTLSLAVFSLTAFLRACGAFSNLRPMLLLLVAYTLPVLAAEAARTRLQRLRPLDYVLGTLDILSITYALALTGGTHSPFFYLYAIPFLIHAFHFDLGMIIWESLLSVGAYLVLIYLNGHSYSSQDLAIYAAQLAFLGVMVASAVITVKMFRRKEQSMRRSVKALETMVTVLNELNGIPLEISAEKLQIELAARLNKLLKPFKTSARVWVYNESWKTLRGFGEHPALRPGAPHHLPVVGCPAFALRRTFSYRQGQNDPCPTEQFNYTSHLCLPIRNGEETIGVLFLGTYESIPWGQEELHFFDTLTHSIALTLQRKGLFERLDDKISELNCSFEVGVSSLATFVGSTQGLDETTVRILDGVISILKVDRASLMLWSSHTQSLRTQWVRGGDFRIRSALSLKSGDGMAGWALKTGEPYWAEYAMGDPHYSPSAQPIKSLLCVPVFTIDHKPLAVINAVTVDRPRAFTAREIAFLKTFGQQAALAIENAQLHHKSRTNIEQLKELDKVKSQFLSLVSHDLRGPLTGVRGFCEVLKEKTTGPLTARQNELIDQLERQVDLQERMVDDLLDLARMQKGNFSIHPVQTNLVELLKDEVDKSQTEAAERRIDLQLMIPDPGRIPFVPLDGNRIRQVVWNLIHNALKFTPEKGRVRLSAHIDSHQVRIDVSDTGVGVAPDMQERVFDKFFQISPGGSKSSQGLGLGLAICKEIITAHQGTIRVTSPGLGLGTTMSFTLPLAQPRAEAESARPLAA